METDFAKAEAQLNDDAKSQICAHAVAYAIRDKSVFIPNAKDHYEMVYAFGEVDTEEEAFPLSPPLIE